MQHTSAQHDDKSRSPYAKDFDDQRFESFTFAKGSNADMRGRVGPIELTHNYSMPGRSD